MLYRRGLHLAEKPLDAQATCTSIDFDAASTLVILKLRICPAFNGSGPADGAGVLPFHRADSIELSEDKSAFPLCIAASAGV